MTTSTRRTNGTIAIGIAADIDAKNAIMSLTNNKPHLVARITGLLPQAPTGGALGTAWSWYMLSPNWYNIFTERVRRDPIRIRSPSGANPPKLRKIAVLMTDGVYNTDRGWKDADR